MPAFIVEESRVGCQVRFGYNCAAEPTGISEGSSTLRIFLDLVPLYDLHLLVYDEVAIGHFLANPLVHCSKSAVIVGASCNCDICLQIVSGVSCHDAFWNHAQRVSE